MRGLLTVIFLLISMVSLGEAADSKASISTSSSKKEKEIKRKKSGKSQQEALSQGYSASEALLMGDIRWNFVATQSFSRGFDELNDTFFSITNLSVSYRVNNWSALSLSTGYDAIALKQDGSIFNNEDPNPDRFGMTDTTISWSIPRIWSTKSSSLNYALSLTAPTSRTSQRATLIGGAFNGLVYRYRPTGKLLLFARGGLTNNVHSKDTADVQGFERNARFGVSYGAGLSYTVLKSLIASTSYSQFQRVTYDNFTDNIQTFRVSLNYIASSQVNIFAGYRFRDTVITNDQLFDDDKSIAFMGGTYAF